MFPFSNKQAQTIATQEKYINELEQHVQRLMAENRALQHELDKKKEPSYFG